MVDSLDLSYIPIGFQTRIRELLPKYEGMWDGNLDKINTTSYRIDLNPGTRPIAQHPYRAGPRARKAEDKEGK